VAALKPYRRPAPVLAPALARLRAEVNELWPDRDKSTDGWLGDAAHQARISQHNPDEWNIVRAEDIDKDGINVKRVLKAAIGRPGVWYVIHDGRIWSRTYGWKARKYTGPNPHKGHIHISLLLDYPSAFVAGKWLGKPSRPAVRDLRRGMHGADVAKWQRALKVTADGQFGEVTEAAVNAFKAKHGWAQDGVIGPRVRKTLRAEASR
jgi:hypothetical protein